MKWIAKLLVLASLHLYCGAAAAQRSVEYVHTDALGSPVAITDASAAVIERSEYEPYGRLLNRAIGNGPGYTGHVDDQLTGLSYMQQRYYDSLVGRFLSVDPIDADSENGDDFNRYTYAYNSPYSFTDPDGQMPLDERQPPPPPLPPPPPITTGPRVTSVAPVPAPAGGAPITDIRPVTVTAPPRPTISLPPIAWGPILGTLVRHTWPTALLIYPTRMDAPACEMPGGPPCGINIQLAEHVKNARPSTKGKHEKGRARSKADKHGGERGDGRRNPYGKRPPGHKGPWPPKAQ